MADQPQPQQPQVTPEMLKKLQGEKEEETKAKSVINGIGNRNWIVKFGKDIAYLSFFPYLWIKEFFSWLFTDKQSKLNQLVNINKVDEQPNTDEISNHIINNKTGEISLQEVVESANNCLEHESPVVTTANNKVLTA